jgi:hypothetical protein
MRALALIGLLAVPALAAFAAFPATLLRLAFGAQYQSGDEVLFLLGVAFTLLACASVAVQFLLGLHRRSFVVALAVVTVAEPLLLLDASTLRTFAVRVLIVQAAAAALTVGLGLRVRRDPLADRDPVL